MIFKLVLTRSILLWFQEKYIFFVIFNNSANDNGNNKNIVVNVCKELVSLHTLMCTYVHLILAPALWYC